MGKDSDTGKKASGRSCRNRAVIPDGVESGQELTAPGEGKKQVHSLESLRKWGPSPFPQMKANHLGIWLERGQSLKLSMASWLAEFGVHTAFQGASPVMLVIKNLPVSAGDFRDAGSIPGWGRPPGGGLGYSLQYSCWENPHGQRTLVSYSW